MADEFISVEVSPRLNRIARRFPRALTRGLVTGVRRALILWQNEITRGLRGQDLKQRSGRLAKAWQSGDVKLKPSGGGAVGSLISKLKYAAIHQHGGVITPKKGQYLAIPLDAEKTAAGVARHAGPREDPELFPLRTGGGKLLLVRVESGAIIPHWALVKSVTIPASRYLTKARDRARKDFGAVFARAVADELEKAIEVG